ncbi:MAG: epoxyqueuosine reductase QueH [Firmicutes bacterium]|nr:epoxyqueuosine reductase QueH [Bacillota bacterium]
MNENYNVKMKEIIKNMDGKKSILLHSCCGPCSTACIERLTNFFDITILYYNPNIEPKDEYEKRKEYQIQVIKKFKSKNKLDILDCDWENEVYRDYVKGLESEPEGGARCNKCYYLRLDYTAKKAKKLGYDFFGTTLTVSPYKHSKTINTIGESISKKYNINFLYSDFKKEEGYKRSIELAKEMNLYRQDYCGCLFAKEYDNK